MINYNSGNSASSVVLLMPPLFLESSCAFLQELLLLLLLLLCCCVLSSFVAAPAMRACVRAALVYRFYRQTPSVSLSLLSKRFFPWGPSSPNGKHCNVSALFLSLSFLFYAVTSSSLRSISPSFPQYSFWFRDIS